MADVISEDGAVLGSRWNPIVFQKVRWQATKPGWVRMRVPEGSQVLLEARVGGDGARAGLASRSG